MNVLTAQTILIAAYPSSDAASSLAPCLQNVFCVYVMHDILRAESLNSFFCLGDRGLLCTNILKQAIILTAWSSFTLLLKGRASVKQHLYQKTFR